METIPVFIVVLAVTTITVLLIILGRKLELSVLPGIATIENLVFLVYHSLKLDSIADGNSLFTSMEYNYLLVGFALLLISFIAFLWVDDIVAKKKNKKSYDDSLSWFWDKI